MNPMEHKFRAWNSKVKLWMPKFQLYSDTGKLVGVNHAYKNIHIMQFTGLKDKNGKEIYEGDILECVEQSDIPEPKWGPVEVVFTHGCFNVVNKKCCKHCRDGYGIICSVYECVGMCKTEIIGNIHENPELIQ